MKDKKGLLDEADGGTLFLDEIGEMAPELQAKLLRVLENGEYIRIGETRATKTDIRVIAATNRDLTREIAEGRFREDLFYRLSVFTIRLPSLADRPEDIEEYVRHFVGQFSQRMACRIVSIDPEYVRLMRRHAWRGNVRELRNVVERSMIMAEDGRLTAGDLPADFRGAEGGDADDPGVAGRHGAAAYREDSEVHRRQQDRGGAVAGHRHRHALPQDRRVRHRQVARPGLFHFERAILSF